MSALLPDNAVLLSFEGPDPYSLVGGLGTRVTEMSAALAEAGTRTTLVFVGDPERPAVEQAADNLEYRRWCQWISAYHPGGVYDGEWGKSEDYRDSVPSFLVDSVVEPAARRGEYVLVIAEDWQTASATIALDRLLRARGLRDRVMLMWNANNTYGFDTMDWPALTAASWITTVSRYMKFELRARGIESLVIPNGIPERIVGGPPEELVTALSAALPSRPLYVKVGRYDEDKRWMQAVDAFAIVHETHPQARLIVRGGREPYGEVIFARLRARGLAIEEVAVKSRQPEDLVDALAKTTAPVVNIRSFVPEELLFALYHVADATLANSGKEPFGLVGLEVMAAGGLAVTGSTGEDYAEPFENAVVCDTGNGSELAAYLKALLDNPALANSIRAAGQHTAERYTWPTALEILARKIVL
ncbi:MAG: glycosyltransferase family 4 protein [Candidatus Eremiobacteraeota bacterium]|nr:glycosyltransferase family 4 protein [Candidatus Eremiobacteraeota bacterium]